MAVDKRLTDTPLRVLADTEKSLLTDS
jgi:hypothetical protein